MTRRCSARWDASVSASQRVDMSNVLHFQLAAPKRMRTPTPMLLNQRDLCEFSRAESWATESTRNFLFLLLFLFEFVFVCFVMFCLEENSRSSRPAHFDEVVGHFVVDWLVTKGNLVGVETLNREV